MFANGVKVLLSLSFAVILVLGSPVYNKCDVTWGGGPCNHDEFACWRQGRVINCLDEDMVCDGEPHCGDSSDEKDCARRCRIGDGMQHGTLCYSCRTESLGESDRCKYFYGRLNMCPTEWCSVKFGTDGRVIARDCAQGMNEALVETLQIQGKKFQISPCQRIRSKESGNREEFECYCKGRLCNYFRGDIPLSMIIGGFGSN